MARRFNWSKQHADARVRRQGSEGVRGERTADEALRRAARGVKPMWERSKASLERERRIGLAIIRRLERVRPKD